MTTASPAFQQLGVVLRSVHRADAAAVDRLSRFGVATVHEAMGRLGLMGPRMRPIHLDVRLYGTAITALLQPGDNWILHVGAEQIRPGDVVVAACTADSTDGFFGDLLATSFKARGCAGLVIDGVRDVHDLTAMRFPVFSRAIHGNGCIKATLGSVNVPADRPKPLRSPDEYRASMARRQDGTAGRIPGPSCLVNPAQPPDELGPGRSALRVHPVEALCSRLSRG